MSHPCWIPNAVHLEGRGLRLFGFLILEVEVSQRSGDSLARVVVANHKARQPAVGTLIVVKSYPPQTSAPPS